jgi:hypothetical protein
MLTSSGFLDALRCAETASAAHEIIAEAEEKIL